ncbi:hypothetical protein CHS0354_034078 [Potamilus streckersoni]|uniref:MAM domain-containing protein n=1 Tax=Potamilus streckersoni TaxID=2493646 RepID=A0AAE0RV27_9BIVA|nr:hypothetical protein CHS0354_034078 [Potamilus streckersoni]
MALRPGNLIRYIHRFSISRCLRVWSTTTTTDGSYINLTIVGCAAHTAVDRSVTGILNEDEWTPVEVDVRSSDYHLIITGGWEFGRKGYLAIDNISMTNGYCPNCDFKDDLCNWNNTGSVNWNLRKEGKRDFEMKKRLRNFISTEILQKEIDYASLLGPVIYGSESKTGQTCLQFSYRIDGGLKNTLSVYLNINGTRNRLWKTAVISHGWSMQYVNVTSGYDFQIEFEGKMGSGYIDVDEVIVLYSYCPG